MTTIIHCDLVNVSHRYLSVVTKEDMTAYPMYSRFNKCWLLLPCISWTKLDTITYQTHHYSSNDCCE